jgi:hypothetical protein
VFDEIALLELLAPPLPDRLYYLADSTVHVRAGRES